MNKPKHFGGMALAALAILLSTRSFAQTSAGSDPTFTVRVEGLTSQERDAVNTDLEARNDLKLVFACVPAGILVFRGESGTTRTSTRAKAVSLMQSRLSTTRLAETTGGIAEAEQACAQQRNR